VAAGTVERAQLPGLLLDLAGSEQTIEVTEDPRARVAVDAAAQGVRFVARRQVSSSGRGDQRRARLRAPVRGVPSTAVLAAAATSSRRLEPARPGWSRPAGRRATNRTPCAAASTATRARGSSVTSIVCLGPGVGRAAAPQLRALDVLRPLRQRAEARRTRRTAPGTPRSWPPGRAGGDKVQNTRSCSVYSVPSGPVQRCSSLPPRPARCTRGVLATRSAARSIGPTPPVAIGSPGWRLDDPRHHFEQRRVAGRRHQRPQHDHRAGAQPHHHRLAIDASCATATS